MIFCAESGGAFVPEADITRIQDTELASQADRLILEWTAHHGYLNPALFRKIVLALLVVLGLRLIF